MSKYVEPRNVATRSISSASCTRMPMYTLIKHPRWAIRPLLWHLTAPYLPIARYLLILISLDELNIVGDGFHISYPLDRHCQYYQSITRVLLFKLTRSLAARHDIDTKTKLHSPGHRSPLTVVMWEIDYGGSGRMLTRAWACTYGYTPGHVYLHLTGFPLAHSWCRQGFGFTCNELLLPRDYVMWCVRIFKNTQWFHNGMIIIIMYSLDHTKLHPPPA